MGRCTPGLGLSGTRRSYSRCVCPRRPTPNAYDFDKYSKQSQAYNGIDVQATARRKGGAFIQGGFSTGHLTYDVCGGDSGPQILGNWSAPASAATTNGGTLGRPLSSRVARHGSFQGITRMCVRRAVLPSQFPLRARSRRRSGRADALRTDRRGAGSERLPPGGAANWWQPTSASSRIRRSQMSDEQPRIISRRDILRSAGMAGAADRAGPRLAHGGPHHQELEDDCHLSQGGSRAPGAG